MAKRYAQRLGFRGQDYTVEIDDPPDCCPRCKKELQQLVFRRWEDETQSKEDFFLNKKYPAHGRKAALTCSCGALIPVCATVHLCEEWITRECAKDPRESYPEDVLKEIVRVRRIMLKVDPQGQLTNNTPGNRLIYETFLPGSERGEDIWIANGANVAQEARLKAPLLIGNRCIVTEGATCGPRAVVVKGSRVKEEVADCLMSDSKVLISLKKLS